MASPRLAVSQHDTEFDEEIKSVLDALRMTPPDRYGAFPLFLRAKRRAVERVGI